MPTKPRDGKGSRAGIRAPRAMANFLVLKPDEPLKRSGKAKTDIATPDLADASRLSAADSLTPLTGKSSAQREATATLDFLFDAEKCIEAIQFLTIHAPFISLEHAGKILFVAEREHLLDWGRPIFGDSYRAVDQKPVPVNTFALIAKGLSESGEIGGLLLSRILVQADSIETYLGSKYAAPAQKRLTNSDQEALLSALRQSEAMSPEEFDEIVSQDFSSEDESANNKPNNTSSLSLWLNEEQLDYVAQTSTVKRGMPD